MDNRKAVTYYRTSSAANVGDDKDSRARQERSVHCYAEQNGITIVAEFYDPAVSGADPIESRKGFAELLDFVEGEDGVALVLVEDASRFARDLLTQELGILALSRRNLTIITANGDNLSQTDDPTKKIMRQMAGAFAEYERARLVQKLRAAREKVRQKEGRCEGRKPPPGETIAAARRLAVTPEGHRHRSLRTIARLLAEQGHTVIINGEPSGKPYSHEAVRRMLQSSAT
jgi:DNA invertase Pin-like site-specific DNA recombinase